MKIDVAVSSLKLFKTDLLAVGVFEDERLNADAKAVDAMLAGELSTVLRKEEFKAEFKQTRLLSTGKNIRNVLLVGLGKKDEYDLERLRKVSATAAKAARNNRIKSFSTILHRIEIKNRSVAERAQAIAEATVLGLYKFNKYKTEKTDFVVESLAVLEEDRRNVKAIEGAVRSGHVIADATNYARDLVNSPACFVTPSALAEEARRIARENNLKAQVFGREEIKSMGMNALLGVSKGSEQEPKFIILEYNPTAKEKIAVVGKGITFDSGGMDLKPPAYMEDMKLDKAGAAAVLGIMQLAAKLRLPLHVIGAMPATENMPGGAAQKPGDVVTAYNKKTIEIINTDAEGRLVLADAISYVEKNYKPSAIIDLATLTGACIIALGYHAAGIFGSENLLEKLKAAGNESFERVWPLPLWQEHKETVKGELADVKNATKAGVADAGAINGAAFLSNFVEKTPWAHIDIAGTAWSPEEREYVPKAATGYGVRLITQLLMDWKK
ncbi:MAG: leucyl aminopeptidase [Candidatus Aenigmarchaeota archaeon]|nr:leucyl aminopeptidase [Candidatus Aenigmarchaeota archaeon]